MVNFESEGKRHNIRVNDTIKRIKQLFQQTNKELVSIARLIPYDPDKVFRFADNTLANNRANASINALISAIILLIRDSSTSEQEAAESAINELLDSMPDAIKNYAPYREGGAQMSTDTYIEMKVREYLSHYLAQCELAIDSGRRNNLPDARILGQLNYMIDRPIPLLKRTENTADTGGFVVALGSYALLNQSNLLSPGQGTYRSPFRSVYRLAMTQSDTAYSEALEKRFENIDIIVGYEWVTAADLRVCPICSQLAGFYPPDFKLRRVHPQCRCYPVPQFCTQTEIDENNKRISNGLEPLPASASRNYISRPHRGMYEWINTHQESLSRSIRKGTVFEWIVSNPKYINVKDITDYIL